jgi:hypothetical protein
LIFRTNCVCNIPYSKQNSARYYHKYKLVFMSSTRFSYQIVTELGFSRRLFEKFCNIIIIQNPSNESQGVVCVPTDGRRDRLGLIIVALNNFANARKELFLMSTWNSRGERVDICNPLCNGQKHDYLRKSVGAQCLIF